MIINFKVTKVKELKPKDISSGNKRNAINNDY